MLEKFMTVLIALTLVAGAIGTIASFSDYEERVAPEQAAEIKDGSFKEDREVQKKIILSAMHPAFIDIQSQFESELDSTKESIKLIKDQINIIIGIDKESQIAASKALANMNDEEKAKLEELRIQFASFMEESEKLSEDITAAINSDKAAAAKVAFDNLITLLGTTNSLDKRKVDMFTDVLSNLQ